MVDEGLHLGGTSRNRLPLTVQTKHYDAEEIYQPIYMKWNRDAAKREYKRDTTTMDQPPAWAPAQPPPGLRPVSDLNGADIPCHFSVRQSAPDRRDFDNKKSVWARAGKDLRLLPARIGQDQVVHHFFLDASLDAKSRTELKIKAKCSSQRKVQKTYCQQSFAIEGQNPALAGITRVAAAQAPDLPVAELPVPLLLDGHLQREGVKLAMRRAEWKKTHPSETLKRAHMPGRFNLVDPPAYSPKYVQVGHFPATGPQLARLENPDSSTTAGSDIEAGMEVDEATGSTSPAQVMDFRALLQRLDPNGNNLLGEPYTEQYARIDAERRKLPVWAAMAKVVEKVQANRVLVVSSPTGSGKSTQMPQVLAHLLKFDGIDSKIFMTQPRRLAASSTSERLGVELDSSKLVGLRMRAVDAVPDSAVIVQMTDGMLFQKFVQDLDLPEAAVVIIDEVHERSVNIDTSLGMLHRLLAVRPDVRVVVMSATANAQTFMGFYDVYGPCLIEVEGQGRPKDTSVSVLAEQQLDYVHTALDSHLPLATPTRGVQVGI